MHGSIKRIRVPGDKSISHRATLFSLFTEKPIPVKGLLESEDVQASRNCVQKIQGTRGSGEEPVFLDCGNSGTTLRLLSGILAGQYVDKKFKLAGDDSLANRPMNRVVDPLRLMGAEIHASGEKGTPPVFIGGKKLKGISYRLPVASAQVKSCILLAGLRAAGETEIIEPASSRDHTERLLRYLGVELETGENRIKLPCQPCIPLKEKPVYVPGDISSAAFFIAAAVLTPGMECVIEGMGCNPTRTGLLDILEEMGVDMERSNERTLSGEPRCDLSIRYTPKLKGVHVKGKIIPRLIDEIPILSFIGGMSGETFEISDAAELRVKESDRIREMAGIFRSFGWEAKEKEDGFVLRGRRNIRGGGTWDVHRDHRIGMTLSVANLFCESPVRLTGKKSIQTSFPGFEDMLREHFQDAR